MGKKAKCTASHRKEVKWIGIGLIDQKSLCKLVLFPFPVPPPPENVVVKRFDSTSIGVSWTKFTLVELKGLADYIITYNIIIDSTTSRKRQSQLGGTMTVPWTQNHIIISGLQTGAEYNVTVRASTAAGISGSYSAKI